MTKGDLLVSIIKSLGYNGENLITAEGADYGDNPDASLTNNGISLEDDYFEVTVNVCEAINRALTRIYDANKLPKKSYYIDTDTDKVSVGGTAKARYDIKSLITDLGKINFITFEDDYTGLYGKNITVRTEGEYLVLEPLRNANQRYILTYTPKVIRIYTEDSDDTPLAYSDELYDKVIYFVKSEFLEETNASLAAYYRNIFEQYLIESDDEPTEVVRHTRDVYHMF